MSERPLVRSAAVLRGAQESRGVGGLFVCGDLYWSSSFPGVASAPGSQRLHHRTELASFGGEHILGSRRGLLIKAPLDDAPFFQSFEARRERVWADPPQRGLEILKSAPSLQENGPQAQHTPPLADDV